MTDILTTIKGLLGGELASKAAAQLGESEGGVQKALAGIVPLVLGGVISKSQVPDGAVQTLSLSQQALRTVGSNLSSPEGLTSLLGSGQPGGSWLSGIFGSAVGPGAITSLVSQYAGVSQDSVGSLLGMAGPAVLGMLGQQAEENNLGASGFASMLAGLKDQVAAMIPAGLSSLTGLLGLGGLGTAATGALGNLGGSLTGSLPGAPKLPEMPAMPGAPAGGAGGGSMRWLWIILGVAVLAALGYYFGRSQKQADTAAATTTTAPADTTRAAAPAADTAKAAPLDAASAAIKAGWAKLGPLEDLKLPDGTMLKVPANGVEKHLVAFLEDKGKPADKTTWFSLDRLLFETGKSSLLPDSQEQLRNVAAILKAYPAVKLKLGGYTDNRGNAALNQKLSAERAQAVQASLEADGTAATRLESEGYGAAHPLASNDTPEGRQQNRRVDVRVTAK